MREGGNHNAGTTSYIDPTLVCVCVCVCVCVEREILQLEINTLWINWIKSDSKNSLTNLYISRIRYFRVTGYFVTL